MLPLTISINAAILSSREILEEYLCRKFPDGKKVLSKSFITVRRRTEYRPDYAYKNEMSRMFGEKPNISSLVYTAVLGISNNYLRHDGNRITVPMEKFGEWQELLPRLSPLLITAGAALQHQEAYCHSNSEHFLIEQIKYSTLPEMDHRLLRDSLAKRGLAELHMHLNGTTEADKVWLDALLTPIHFMETFKNALGENIQEQLDQNGHILTSIFSIYKALLLAARLRYLMAKAIYVDMESLPSQKELKMICDKNAFTENIDECHRITNHPVAHFNPQLSSSETVLQLEGRFILKVLQELQNDNDCLAQMFHCYILIQSYFCGLLIQQRNQTGFDQFQRIADNKLRDPSETNYSHRFSQLQEHQPCGKKFIEGRFAPKNKIEKNLNLLRKIISGWEYCNKSDSAALKDLQLTAHFIKLKDNNKSTNVRHHELRCSTFKSALKLCLTLKANPKLQPYVSSADAAANELHAGPEVFAPTFRLLRAKGWKQFTYHVGEDFHHIASGLRAIWEAIFFLELSSGDRIGHGTALGIDPTLWRERIGSHISMTREEWLDTLVFVYVLLCDDLQYSALSTKFADAARRHATKMYENHEKRPSLTDMVAAWKMRYLDPMEAFSVTRGSELPVSSWRMREEQLIQKEQDKSSAGFALFNLYHQKDSFLTCNEKSKKNVDRAKELIRISTDEIPFNVITILQKKVIQLLNKRQVAVEIMPTSNTLISIYKDHSEHHIFRLLGCDSNTRHPIGVCPTICLASDDPGIFATCLQNEYAHVYRELINKGKTEREALIEIERLVDNGWAFAFRRNNTS